jgi:imidazole glycerol phosphate synthase subunit HisF
MDGSTSTTGVDNTVEEPFSEGMDIDEHRAEQVRPAADAACAASVLDQRPLRITELLGAIRTREVAPKQVLELLARGFGQNEDPSTSQVK